MGILVSTAIKTCQSLAFPLRGRGTASAVDEVAKTVALISSVTVQDHLIRQPSADTLPSRGRLS